jgi:hypothetical protein
MRKYRVCRFSHTLGGHPRRSRRVERLERFEKHMLKGRSQPKIQNNQQHGASSESTSTRPFWPPQLGVTELRLFQ